ncbi:hypothetical protein KKD70_02550 [Patescibacteria group bacterium]|nr:hypothetical protein [Patescibacteria group bacterium]
MANGSGEQTEDQKAGWEAIVNAGAKMNLYNNRLLGIHDKAANEPPTPDEAKEFIDKLGKLDLIQNEKGEVVGVGPKTSGDLASAIDQQARINETAAIDANETGFYKEVYDVAKKQAEKRFETGKTYSRFEKFMNAIPRRIKLLPSIDKKYKKYEKFIENLTKYEELKNELVALDGAILYTQRELQVIEDEIVKTQGTSNEEIWREQAALRVRTIAEATKQKVQKLIPMQKVSKNNNAIWADVENELKLEGEKLTKKFSGKIDALFQKRQSLLNELAQYDKTNPNHTRKTYKLREEIYDCDIKLEGIKQNIIKYRSGNPIFLFERIMGIKSIPILDRYSQNS